MDQTPTEFSLEGKVALITGGSRGIGKAIAAGFVRHGADVALVSRKLPDLEQAAGEIGGPGRRVLAVAAHVGKMEEIGPLVERVREELGHIDILVNGAATNPTVDPALDFTERAWDAIMNLNLKGLFFLSQAAARVMKDQGGGSIINISSVEGIRTGGLPVYAISKAGVIHASKVMAQEWAAYNIRVNVLAPGMVKTRFSEYLWQTPEIRERILRQTPMARFAEPEEMVGAALFLASGASSFMTGQVVTVDGGLTL